jgi:DnaK suppressor protein
MSRSDIDIEYFKKRLVHLKHELQALLELSQEASSPVVLDQTSVGRLSRMDAMQRQAMAQETERRRRVEVQKIEAALKRMDEGEYGYCIKTGEEIPLKRLELDPAAATIVQS